MPGKQKVGLIMIWELVILGISFVILTFDVIWQFYVAGMYAPKKARALIINDPYFKKLDEKLESFEGKLVTLEGEIAAPRGEILQIDMDSVKNDVTDIKDNLVKKFSDLKSSIGGMIGQQIQGFKGNMEIDQEEAFENLDPESPLSQVKIKEYEKQATYEMVCNALQVVMPEDQAESWAYRYTIAPPYIKKWIKKKINKWTGGFLDADSTEIEV